jgi:hypothetical protein
MAAEDYMFGDYYDDDDDYMERMLIEDIGVRCRICGRLGYWRKVNRRWTLAHTCLPKGGSRDGLARILKDHYAPDRQVPAEHEPRTVVHSPRGSGVVEDQPADCAFLV